MRARSTVCADLSQMGAIIDLSIGVALFRHLTDQSFVQLERETNGHLYLSLEGDTLSQPISDKNQLQGFQEAKQVRANLDKSERNSCCLAASSHNHIIIDKDIRQHNRPVTTDQLQTVITTPVSHTRQHPGSLQHPSTNFASFTVKANESDPDVSVERRRPQELMERLEEVQPRRGIPIAEKNIRTIAVFFWN